MREITDHHDGHGLAEKIDIFVLDEPGPGGANHLYRVDVRLTADPDWTTPQYGSVGRLRNTVASVQFQRGPRDEPGSTPGIIDTVLLAIVADRLRAFQAGPFACDENGHALERVKMAMKFLKHRANERAKRGVLGKSKK